MHTCAHRVCGWVFGAHVHIPCLLICDLLHGSARLLCPAHSLCPLSCRACAVEEEELVEVLEDGLDAEGQLAVAALLRQL